MYIFIFDCSCWYNFYDFCRKCPEKSEIRQQAVDVLIPLTMESCSEYLHDVAQRTLDKIIGDPETETHQQKLYYEVLKHTYELILMYTKSK